MKARRRQLVGNYSNVARQRANEIDQRQAVELAIQALGKRKEYASKAIILLNRLLAEELEGHPEIIRARDVIMGYRKSLDEI